MLEREIEQYLKKRIEALGGLCLKFTSPSMRGVPDRVVIRDGRAVFVELKAPGKAPRPDQRKAHEEFQKRGVLVFVVDSKSDVDYLIGRGIL